MMEEMQRIAMGAGSILVVFGTMGMFLWPLRIHSTDGEVDWLRKHRDLRSVLAFLVLSIGLILTFIGNFTLPMLIAVNSSLIVLNIYLWLRWEPSSLVESQKVGENLIEANPEGVQRRARKIFWTLTAIAVGGILFLALWVIGPWGELGGIDPEAWLGFWGTLASAVLAGAVAATVLAYQSKKQDEHLRITLEEQREQARKEREIQALTILNAVLADGYSEFPNDSRIDTMKDNQQRLVSAVANWQMNWGIESPEELEVDWQIDGATITLGRAYALYGKDAMYFDEVTAIHIIFGDWIRSISSYVNAPPSDRRVRLIELGHNLHAATNALIAEHLAHSLKPPFESIALRPTSRRITRLLHRIGSRFGSTPLSP